MYVFCRRYKEQSGIIYEQKLSLKTFSCKWYKLVLSTEKRQHAADYTGRFTTTNKCQKSRWSKLIMNDCWRLDISIIDKKKYEIEVEWVIQDKAPTVLEMIECIDIFQPFFRVQYPVSDNLYHLYKYVNRPRVLQKTDRICNYLYSHKIDGIHKLICSTTTGAITSFGIDGNITSLGQSTNLSWVVEAELINKDYVALDIIFYNGYQIYDPHAIRMARIGLLDYKLVTKEYVEDPMDLTDISYSTDGIILTSMLSYKEPIYKHKEGKQLTVDFLIRIQQDSAHMYLSSNINGTIQLVDFAQIDNTNLTDDAVYECFFDGSQWVPIRYREDKTCMYHTSSIY